MRSEHAAIGLALTALIMGACTSQNEELLKLPKYEGPVAETYDVSMLYSDSAVVKLKVEAPIRFAFENGDSEFPEGIYIEFYDNTGDTTNTLKANYCYYTAEENVYKATGDVIVKGLKNKEQLNTEELFWSPQREKIYTEKFVRIETENEITMGHGLEASQDFSTYTIKKSSGSISLD